MRRDGPLGLSWDLETLEDYPGSGAGAGADVSLVGLSCWVGGCRAWLSVSLPLDRSSSGAVVARVSQHVEKHGSRTKLRLPGELSFDSQAAAALRH